MRVLWGVGGICVSVVLCVFVCVFVCVRAREDAGVIWRVCVCVRMRTCWCYCVRTGVCVSVFACLPAEIHTAFVENFGQGFCEKERNEGNVPCIATQHCIPARLSPQHAHTNT